MVDFLAGLEDRRPRREVWGTALLAVVLLLGAGMALTGPWMRPPHPQRFRPPGIGPGRPDLKQAMVERAAFVRTDPVLLRHSLVARGLMQGAALAAQEIHHRTGAWPQSPADYFDSPALTCWALNASGGPWPIVEGTPPRHLTPFTCYSRRNMMVFATPRWPASPGCLLYTQLADLRGGSQVPQVLNSRPEGVARLLGGQGAAPYPLEACLIPLGDAAQMYGLLHGTPPPDLATLLDAAGLALIRGRWEPLLPDLSAIECWQDPDTGWYCLAVQYRGQWRYVTSTLVVRGRPAGGDPQVLWRQTVADADPVWIGVEELRAEAPL